MLPRRATLRAAGEGALLGVAAGLILGLWHVRVGRDLDHAMLWLAAERVVTPAVMVGLAGIALSLLLAGVAALWRTFLPHLRQSGALLVGSIVVIATFYVFMIRDQVFPLAPRSGSPRLTLLAIGAILGCGLLLTALRLMDMLRDPDEHLERFQWRGLNMARGGGVVLALALGLLLAWPYLSARRAGGHPSVIIVSLDTLRADRLGALGMGPSLTPLLDELADEGMLFTQAHATAPWTLPSHASLFTSLLPFDHHVRWSWMRISPEQAMLAEHFRNAGYRTGAFTGGGYMAGLFGFAQGFQVYEDHDEIKEGGPERIAAAAGRWVEDAGDAPFFMFLHTYEVHSPFLREAADGSPAGRLAEGVTFKEIDAIHGGELVLNEDERRHVVGLYDADVAHVDQVIGGLLQQLRDAGRLDDTILVVLSDHGEDLWDHSAARSPGHGHSLYQELIRVPLFVRAPGRVPGGKRLHTPVSLLDVAPSLLALAGLRPDPRHAGRSLETSLLTATEPESVPVHAESVEYGPDRFMERLGNIKAVLAPLPDKAHHDVRLPVAPLEIFQLALDPRELHNLARTGVPPEDASGADLMGSDDGADHATISAARPLVNELRRRAEEKLFGEEGQGEDELPPELEEQLRSLGYIK